MRIALVFHPTAVNEPISIILAEPGLAAADGLLRFHSGLLDLTARIVSPHTDIGKMKLSVSDIAKEV
jgi:hypothetical protein